MSALELKTKNDTDDGVHRGEVVYAFVIVRPAAGNECFFNKS